MADLKKIKGLLFENIDLVLSNLEIEYEAIGDNIYSSCPVHEDSDNPRAFSLSLDKQIWKCWTRECQNHYSNDIFGLIRGVLSNKEGVDVGFGGALKWSCKVLNVSSRDVKIMPREVPSDFVKMVGMFTDGDCEFEQPSVAVNCKLEHPSDYFNERGFSEDSLLHFEVGDCKEKGSTMYERAVIPIHDDTGSNIIASIGRSIKEYRTPKFLFSKGFDKRHFFYNYHRAIESATEKSCLFITEGQGDVWKMYEAGVKNCVSIFGKTISREQERKLHKTPITRLVILTDNDQAGRESKTQIQRQLGRMYKLTFPRLSRKDIGDMSVDKIKEDILSEIEGTY